ncbi:DUF6702 family protein [Lutimonas sp.]|uniref:DUF6702 family protein n=1 Tax=Lutimonas sp. TaxID=1872403 RepID=UPI003D9BC017
MSFGVHKHYISLTKVDFIKEKEVVQVTMKFFIDDIESALENRHGEDLQLTTKDEHPSTDQFIERYIKQKFKVWINEQEKEFSYIGKEYENDSVLFYLEFENISGIESIEVQNAMLFEAFEEQQNYLKFNVNDIRKTIILVKANPKERLNF